MNADKPDLAPLGPWKVPSTAVEEHAAKHNIPTLDFPNKSKPVALKAVQAGEPVAEWVTVTLKIPESVDRQIKRKAFDDHCTNQAFVLRALAEYGIEMPAEVLINDRRKKNRKAV